MKLTDAIREYAKRTFFISDCAAKSDAIIGPLGKTCDDFENCAECENFALNAIAERIEREMMPRPLFEDGEPVQFGDEFQSWNGKVEKVRAIEIVDDARLMIINGNSLNNYIVGETDSNGKFVKRPEPQDTWERIEEDANKGPCGYFNGLVGRSAGFPCGECQARENPTGCLDAQRLDIVRRCRELAEAGR